ncbi:putative nuclear distribution protein ro10 [Erysiphe neolycopersici]|uniref:Putative nuclear distribution protein ro10 n=1 Tax=Erysiphe neolycopersici TaxID=212602 RepID=A0A420HS13_9PEZI|nr:putative nuclear distribution protein ro10 [Erysiphe neolycopersici]
MANSFDVTALETIDLLQGRLERIEYILFGDVDVAFDVSNGPSISERLLAVENRLQQVVLESKPLKELHKLYSNHPNLFRTPYSESVPTSTDITTMLSVINASASLYSETASRLSSMNDIPIPSSELSAQLIALQPQIAKIEAIQANQVREVRGLLERSAAIIEKWYLTNILEYGEIWASIDKRMSQIEQKIRQAKHAKQRDVIAQEKD